MRDYSNHPYGKLLTYIEEGCQRLKEERDYVNYLLSMERVKSIEELIKIYNNTFKLLAYIFYGTLDFPYYWYYPETWGRFNYLLAEDLNCFFNENILKWYKRQENVTVEQCQQCLSNLRGGANAHAVEIEIIDGFCTNEEIELVSLSYIINRHFSLLKDVATKTKNRQGLIHNYISCSKELAAYGRIFDIVETSFGEDFDISYDGLAEQYKSECELAEQRKKVVAKKRKNKTGLMNALFMPNPIMDKVGGTLFSIILSLPLAFLGAVLPFGKGGRR